MTHQIFAPGNWRLVLPLVTAKSCDLVSVKAEGCDKNMPVTPTPMELRSIVQHDPSGN